MRPGHPTKPSSLEAKTTEGVSGDQEKQEKNSKKSPAVVVPAFLGWNQGWNQEIFRGFLKASTAILAGISTAVYNDNNSNLNYNKKKKKKNKKLLFVSCSIFQGSAVGIPAALPRVCQECLTSVPQQK